MVTTSDERPTNQIGSNLLAARARRWRFLAATCLATLALVPAASAETRVEATNYVDCSYSPTVQALYNLLCSPLPEAPRCGAGAIISGVNAWGGSYSMVIVGCTVGIFCRMYLPHEGGSYGGCYNYSGIP